MKFFREIEIIRAGSLTTIQDAGRIGLAHLAVPPSGALDQRSWSLANRLVGNDDGEAVLETTLSGVALRTRVDCTAAVTGALASMRLDSRPIGGGLPIFMRAGQTLLVGPALEGVRNYISFGGGIAVRPVLGSRSTDILSNLGPAIVHDGDVLPLGLPKGPAAKIDFAPYPIPSGHLDLLLNVGPRHKWLSDKSFSALLETQWTVTSQSNRIALRLEGQTLSKSRSEELPSEGIVTGAVQVPHNGQPIIFLADHPTTGGYPVVGVVDQRDLARCAQASPGTSISFHLSPSAI